MNVDHILLSGHSQFGKTRVFGFEIELKCLTHIEPESVMKWSLRKDQPKAKG